jgi:hypothetical protein
MLTGFRCIVEECLFRDLEMDLRPRGESQSGGLSVVSEVTRTFGGTGLFMRIA